MKAINYLVITILVCNTACSNETQIKRVPSDYQTIALAVEQAVEGDTIILSPGIYHENGIEINKSLTISSEWILSGDTAMIESTVIDAGDTILFTVITDDVEISGLKVINGDHTFDLDARVTIKYNHMVNNKDAISMESNAGGYIGFNLIENSGDDGIDLDIGKSGTDIIVENNKIVNSNDDGIEIRLFSDPNQNIRYDIRNNIIIGSKKAGIQLISYDVYTGKVFYVHHNIIRNCKTALGCMDGSATIEDLSGALYMDEAVYFYNNTILDNEMGATGGNNIIAINNIVKGNTVGGFKRFGSYSVVTNNLFYNNKDNNFVGFSDSLEQYDNISTIDPLLDEITLRPVHSSPCIDSGLKELILYGITVIEIATEEYSGSDPDIGAVESDGENSINN